MLCIHTGMCGFTDAQLRFAAASIYFLLRCVARIHGTSSVCVTSLYRYFKSGSRVKRQGAWLHTYLQRCPFRKTFHSKRWLLLFPKTLFPQSLSRHLILLLYTLRIKGTPSGMLYELIACFPRAFPSHAAIQTHHIIPFSC